MLVCLHPMIQLELFNYDSLPASNGSGGVVKLWLLVCIQRFSWGCLIMLLCLHPMILLELFNYVTLSASNDSAGVVKLC